MLRYRSSAFKHGYSKEDAEHVLAEPLGYYPDGYSLAGNDSIMFVGLNADGVCLEVKVEYEEFDDQEVEWVFHINKALRATKKRAGL